MNDPNRPPSSFSRHALMVLKLRDHPTPSRVYTYPHLRTYPAQLHLPITYPHITTSPTRTCPPMPHLCYAFEQHRHGPSPSSPTAMGSPNLASGALKIPYLHLATPIRTYTPTCTTPTTSHPPLPTRTQQLHLPTPTCPCSECRHVSEQHLEGSVVIY